MAYFHRSPWFLRWYYSELKWREKVANKLLYLTFDDGPVPEATPEILQILSAYKVKATFFCVGENIKKYPEVFKQVLSAGHAIGNHTQNHLNGWKTNPQEYISNLRLCAEEIRKYGIQDTIFRPPYGRIRKAQIREILNDYKIIMWDVLSGDFDPALSAEECYNKSVKATRQGSIVVFHDSIKSIDKLREVLPKYIDHFQSQGFKFLPL